MNLTDYIGYGPEELEKTRIAVEEVTGKIVSRAMAEIIQPELRNMEVQGASQNALDTVLAGVFCTLVMRHFSSLTLEVKSMVEASKEVSPEHLQQARNLIYQKSTFFLAYRDTLQKFIMKDIDAMLDEVVGICDKLKKEELGGET